jgi:FtsZ-interacting cell division protein YlmF
VIVDKHIKNLDTSDLDKLDDQLEKMGDDLEKAMEGLDADMAKLGDKLSKDLAKNLGKDMFKDFAKQKFKFGPDSDDDDDNDHDNHANDTDDHDGTDDDDLPNASADADDADLRAAVDHLKNFALKPAQKDAIAKLRASADAKVAGEQRALDEASKQLETALANVNTRDEDITRAVDRITAHEAAIRKARLLSWVQARRVLDADQVKQLEDATGKTR